MQSLFKTFLKLCFCNCPHQPAMSCMHKKTSLITERYISLSVFFFFLPLWYCSPTYLPVWDFHVSERFWSFSKIKSTLKKESLANIHSLKIKRGLSRASRCLYPGPGARNTRQREQSTFQDVQKNVSLALKAIPKGESKKAFSSVNNYNTAVINSSKAIALKWYHFSMVKFYHIYQNLSPYIYTLYNY